MTPTSINIQRAGGRPALAQSLNSQAFRASLNSRLSSALSARTVLPPEPQ
jgi:hypothetical protein